MATSKPKLYCDSCNDEIRPGERRVSWTNKDKRNEVTERGAVHLSCLTPGYHA